MIGGDKEAVERLDPIFEALAPGAGDIDATPGREGRDPRVERGYMHCGPSGAGHFVKMVHNGIEYGLMQAYAEGFDILRGAASEALPEDQRFELDLPDIAEVWRRGSVIGSWLLDLTAMALAEDPEARALFRLRRRFRRRAAGPSRRRSRRPCRPMCCRPRSTPASARANRKPSPTSCCRRCATSSAAMSSPRRTSDDDRPQIQPRRPCVLVIFGAAAISPSAC